RAALPATMPLYDEAHQRDDCACGEVLVWRSGGRSRLDRLGPDARCLHCGAQHAYSLSGDPGPRTPDLGPAT
ncbi:MAG: hypothetical protein J0M02_18625, partial [Planctomycetes bacterium]|nr:hypothetical protein [Planctomycetota bacterium]